MASAKAPSTIRKRPASALNEEPIPLVPCTPGQPLVANAAMLRRMLEVIEHEILPKTEVNVAEGNKVFGAAILRDDESLTTVVADSNHEMLCPLYHGEMWTIKQWSELPADKKPSAAECVFLSTHEPCCMCISGIVWSGFKKCFYLYPYETTKAQGIPHDLSIMYNLWQVPRYAPCNAFTSTAGIYAQIENCEGSVRDELLKTAERITKKYDELSTRYHSEKTSNPGNTLAFN